MPDYVAAPAAPPPARLKAPTSPQEAGLGADLLMRLSLKMLYGAGELAGTELAGRMGVPFSVIGASLEFLKAQRHCEVVAGAFLGPSSYRYRITSEGRTVARLFLQHDQYVGPAPVPIAQYTEYMYAMHRASPPTVTRAAVREAFSDLVLADRVLDEIGTAVRGGRSLFIYGPPGNGKTVISHRIQKLLSGDIAIPHALDVEGAVIRLFDPVNHEARPSPDAAGTLAAEPQDRRWVMCKRPIVKVGGELLLESLDLIYEPRLGYYRAPLQVLANGGVLIIDDFGRQRSTPADLLNRWMVPLESGLDYLTLQSGQKFEVPFLTFVAFATNLKPSQLVDEAFLRRVPFKVFAENPTRDAFTEIFERCCRDRGVDADAGLAQYLLDGYYRTHRITPRACQPRDLISQAILLAEYRNQPRTLTEELLDTACANYFVEEQE